MKKTNLQTLNSEELVGIKGGYFEELAIYVTLNLAAYYATNWEILGLTPN